MGFGLPRVSDVCVCWCGAMRSGLYDLKKNYFVNYMGKWVSCCLRIGVWDGVARKMGCRLWWFGV